MAKARAGEGKRGLARVSAVLDPILDPGELPQSFYPVRPIVHRDRSLDRRRLGLPGLLTMAA
jgi:hypothetical protein